MIMWAALVVMAAALVGSVAGAESPLRVGAAQRDMTVPGTPLAGYNFDERKVDSWPLPTLTKYSSFMNPAHGSLTPIYARAVVLENDEMSFCWVSLEILSPESSMNWLAWNIAKGRGFDVPYENVVFMAAHTHSSMGSYVPRFAGQLTPTWDIFVPEVQQQMAEMMAEAMVDAWVARTDALVGHGRGLIANMTKNRRADISPYVTEHSIDPELQVLAFDDAVTGDPIATIWNFAIHGTCYYVSNMYYSSDVMGDVSLYLEEQGRSGVALFMNRDEGDINPNGDACANKRTAPSDPPGYMNGAFVIGGEVMRVRGEMEFSGTVEIATSSLVKDFGPIEANWTLSRNLDCRRGGPHNICTICYVTGASRCTINLPAGEGWTEEVPRFTGLRLSFLGQDVLIVTIPGEPLLAVGTALKADCVELGFDHCFISSLTNNYLNYIADPDEYLVGGYEAALTLWGINTSTKIRQCAFHVSHSVAPPLRQSHGDLLY